MSFIIPTYTHWPYVIPNATPTSDGVMSAADKAKLDSLIPGGGTTLAQTYLNGANPVDSTILTDAVRGPVGIDASGTANGVPGLVVTKDNGVAGVIDAAGIRLANDSAPAPGNTAHPPAIAFTGASEIAGAYQTVNFYLDARPSIGAAAGRFVVTSETGAGPLIKQQLLTLNSAAPGTLELTGIELDLTGAALNDVLTFDGTKFAPAPGGGGGGTTLAQTYQNGANPVDSTIVTDAVRGPVAIDASTSGGGSPALTIEQSFSAAGILVQDTATGVLTRISPQGYSGLYGFNAVVLDVAPSPILRLTADSSGPNIPVVRAEDDGGLPYPLDLQLGELRVNGAPGAAGEVLTSQGAGLPPVWAAGGGGGSIGGAIGLNQVAFGTALNTIGGDPQLTFVSGTGVFALQGASPFFTANRTTNTVTIENGTAPTKSVILTEAQVSVADGATDVALLTVGGRGALGTTSAPLTLLLPQELQINNNPGALGEVLTSQGAGLPPVWAAGGGGGGVASVTASAPLASSGGVNPDISLNTSGVVAATYTNATVTVDTYGRVTSASSGTVAPVLTIGEIPGGLVNGVNVVFTTAANFTANTTMLYVNGVRQLRGAGNDYTETGANQITLTVAPLAGFQLQIDYYPV